jgi:hypothetical protein
MTYGVSSTWTDADVVASTEMRLALDKAYGDGLKI